MSSDNLNYIITPHGWKQLKDLVKQRYGPPLISDIELLEKEKLKIVRLRNKITFNKRCKKDKLIPHWCQMKDHWNTSKKMTSNVTTFQQRSIQNAIDKSYYEIGYSEKIVTRIEDRLRETIPDLFPTIQNLIQGSCQYWNMKIKATQIRKFEKLKVVFLHSRNKRQKKKTLGFPESVINLSKRDLCEKELDLTSAFRPNITANYSLRQH